MKAFFNALFIVVYIFTLCKKTCGSNSSSLPNYITEEEFEAAKIALNFSTKFGNSSAPRLPGNSSFTSLIRPGFKFTTWPQGKIPYTIDPSFSTADRTTIATAIQNFHDFTCLRFIPKTSFNFNYLDIVQKTDDSSRTEVCMVGGRQVAEFGGSGIDVGKITKAMGHTICMSREETRRDRDKWIAFNAAICVTPTIDSWCFFKGLDKLYDYLSIEHDDSGCSTGCYQPKQDNIVECGSGGSLSVLDIEAINEVYNCNSGCLGYRFVNINKPWIVNPFLGGADFDGTLLYTCRAYHQGDIIPGRYKKVTKECYVPWGGQEHLKTADVEVFTTPTSASGGSYQWISISTPPPNAVRGGRTNFRETLYIIRCLYSSMSGQPPTWIPGKYQASAGPYIAYGGVEIRCGSSIPFQFLVCS